MFLLDTDHIGILQRRTQPEYGRLVQNMGGHPTSAFYFSGVSLHELVMGANNYVNQATTTKGIVRGYEMLERDLVDFCKAQVLPFDVAAGLAFESLRAQKIRIGTMDLRIGSIALTKGFIVLTRNLKDFNQVPGLKVEDWTN